MNFQSESSCPFHDPFLRHLSKHGTQNSRSHLSGTRYDKKKKKKKKKTKKKTKKKKKTTLIFLDLHRYA